jgi:formiminoglutamate deiminase
VTERVWHCAQAWLGGATVATDVTVRAEDGTITAVESDAGVPSDAERLGGVVLPGFANVHSHAFQRALRGRAERDRGSFWSWRDAMYELASKLTPDSYRELATATYAEMVCAGFTTVGEFHYLHHDADGTGYADPNEMSIALADAAGAAGIRLTLLDTCYLGSSPGHLPHGVQRRFADASGPAWASRVEQLRVPPGRVLRAAAIHSIRAVPPADAAAVAEWAVGHAVPLHAHVSEQPRENEEVLAAYGTTPTSVLGAAGALTERFTAVHATHLTSEDRWRLGDASAMACICPTTEQNLADGLCELTPLLGADVAPTVGTDSHTSIDPFEELRGLDGHERLRTLDRGTFTPESLLEVGTATGHRALGWERGGRIAVGAPCDLVSVSLDSERLAGADPNDLLGAIVAAACAADVFTVVVGGELLVDDGFHRFLDVPASLGRAIAAIWP